MAVSVSETMQDTATASDTVAAKALNTRPTTPPISRIGRKTAISEQVIETMVKPTSREPRSAASRGCIPSSTWRTMASSITIASSTTRPTASVSPSNVTLSMP